MIEYNEDKLTALEAMEQAQWLAFAPVVFQASRALRNLGILTAIEKRQRQGMELSEIESECGLSTYGARVLCEAGLAAGLLFTKEGKYYNTRTASFFNNDPLTEANTDFINDVCYNGLFDLEDSIRNGKPEGLKHFGKWNTVYEALAELPPKVRDSWFKFDHYFSDNSFGTVLPLLFEHKPSRILDIGGNTGKFAFQALEYSSEVEVGIMDLPGQLNMAKEMAKNKGLDKRMQFIQANILDESQQVPQGYDIIWMSQFLDCFSEEQIISILERCSQSMQSSSRVCILEPLWDRQRFKASAFSLQMTSLYFTCIANGNSQMYHSDTFYQLVKKAGLDIESIHDGIGLCHTLLVCKK
ncbi:MAG: methyltransferase domain-containing protein [Bacteroidetes bacterium]|nr:methyltransferase domain-containing protein [Bacteroidota bacterium]